MRRRGALWVVGLVGVLGGAGCDSGAKDPSTKASAAKAAPDSIVRDETIDLASSGAGEAIGLPVSGKVEISIDLQHAKDDLSKASGTIRVRCPKGCRLGDDHAKLVPKLKNARASAFVGDGILFGHIDFDSFDVVVTVADGLATIAKWDVQSKDVTLIVEGTLKLGKWLGESDAKLCVRFAATPGLQERDPKTAAVVMTTGATTSPKDGMFNIELVDRIDRLKRLSRVCDGSAPPADVPSLATPPADVPSVATPPAVTPPDPVEPSDPATAALIRATVKQTSPTSFDVDRANLDKVLANPTILARSARLVPAVRDGKATGFKLYAIRAGSLYAALGFLNGDTLTSVGGMPLATPDQALEVYTKIRDYKAGQTVTVIIERKGAPVTLTYTLR